MVFTVASYRFLVKAGFAIPINPLVTWQLVSDFGDHASIVTDGSDDEWIADLQ